MAIVVPVAGALQPPPLLLLLLLLLLLHTHGAMADGPSGIPSRPVRHLDRCAAAKLALDGSCRLRRC